MARFRATSSGNVPFTSLEEEQRDAEEFIAAKDNKRSELSGAYSAAITQAILHDGVMWRAGKDDQTLLANVLAVGSVPIGMYWRDVNDIPHDMTYADLQSLAYAILDRALGYDQNLMTKLQAVNAAQTIEEIDAISW